MKGLDMFFYEKKVIKCYDSSSKLNVIAISMKKLIHIWRLLLVFLVYSALFSAVLHTSHESTVNEKLSIDTVDRIENECLYNSAKLAILGPVRIAFMESLSAAMLCSQNRSLICTVRSPKWSLLILNEREQSMSSLPLI